MKINNKTTTKMTAKTPSKVDLSSYKKTKKPTLILERKPKPTLIFERKK